jgi:16S rRNA processing protein RimM
MAVIGAAHGIKGEVRVKSFTADPAALGDYGPLESADGRRFEVLEARPAGSVVVVRFKGVADRSAAETLNGTALFVDRSALPEGDDDEFYHADLIGLAVRDEAGTVIGTVRAVQNFGGGDILDVAGPGGDVLIPFTRAAVPQVDLAAGFLGVDRLAAGLVDDEQDSGASGGGPRERPRGPKDAGGNR